MASKTGQIIFTKYAKITGKRFFNCTQNLNSWKRDKIPGPRIESFTKSINSKGFLRSNKPYLPAGDVSSKIDEICSSEKIAKNHVFKSLDEKFKILQAFNLSFQHSVPNSQLHEINSIVDVIHFYQTPVDTTLPLDAIRKMELPENLHIQNGYKRFVPEEDTMFKGQTAFPKSSTLVTGLKYRGKYSGSTAKSSWP